ncbi:HAD-IIA family hydrolase [Christensenellaceae bacterium OttesenSCG-928-K19]|nr:HAD-IIA family hydrolase [Christensenellaceae bacterium OttesenSCG-928-K19]
MEMQPLELLREKQGFICDMDGVIYHGNRLLDGVKEFVDWLRREDKHFLFLTNSSERTPLELKQKLQRMGLDVEEDHFYTSALATAKFLKQQSPNSSVFAVGEAGLTNALYEAGLTMNDVNPEYVVMGETRNYNYESILRAVRFVQDGAKLIATNPDLTAPSETGIIPACRALISPIEMATGKGAYYIGKPNALMMRTGLKILGVHSADAVMVGDRMDTDIIAGIESGMTTVLVLSGVSTVFTIQQFAYRPMYILDGVGNIPPGDA